MDGVLVYCKDTCEMTEELQLQYASEQWRLFIDSSKVILKAVLLHNGNKHLSISLTHAVPMKETYANIQGLLKKKNTARRPPVEHTCWTEGVEMLTGLQGGSKKSCSVLCEWDRRASQWLLRAEMVLSLKNVAQSCNRKDENIFTPTSHKTWIN